MKGEYVYVVTALSGQVVGVYTAKKKALRIKDRTEKSLMKGGAIDNRCYVKGVYIDEQ